ncbi:MAG: heme biosynthesis HemY N-terminal domain-containing protein [Rhodospirillaceae bacterium]
MLRLILLLIVVALLVALGVWLAEEPGTFVVDWLGWKLESTVSVLLLLLAILVGTLVIGFRVLGWIVGIPKAWGVYRSNKLLRRSALAMSELPAALHGGDSDRARTLLSDARKALNGAIGVDQAAAELAIQAGDTRAARLGYVALLDNPRAQAAARRGLLGMAVAEGDEAGALKIAKDAMANGVDAAWAVEAVFSRLIANEDWAEAESLANKHWTAVAKHCGQPIAKVRAALLVKQAEALAASGDTGQALKAAQKAIDADPDLTEAALLIARLHKMAGRVKKAVPVLAAQWRRHPEPAIGAAYLGLFAGEDAQKVAKRAEELAAVNPDHPLSKEVVAQAALDAQNWAVARTNLSLFTGGDPTKAICKMMAALEEGDPEGAGKDAALDWLRKALDAPDTGGLYCENCGRSHSAWEALCESCGSVGSVTWKMYTRSLQAAPAEEQAAAE